MNAKASGELAFNIVVASAIGLVLVLSLGYDERSAIIPLVISVISLSILVCMIVLRLLKGVPEGQAQDEEPGPGRYGSWFLAYVVAIVGFGFIVATPIFSFILLRVEAGVRVGAAIGLSVILSLVLYVAFVEGLRVNLWPGAIPEVIDELIGGGDLPPL